MKVKLILRYAREPELVALKCDPSVYFPGLVKTALRSYVTGQEFTIKLSKNVNYEIKPMSCNLVLDDIEDKDIINLLKSIKTPNTTFIRNVMMRAITGNVDFVYTNQRLKQISTKEYIKTTKKEKKKNIEDPLQAALLNIQKKNII